MNRTHQCPHLLTHSRSYQVYHTSKQKTYEQYHTNLYHVCFNRNAAAHTSYVRVIEFKIQESITAAPTSRLYYSSKTHHDTIYKKHRFVLTGRDRWRGTPPCGTSAWGGTGAAPCAASWCGAPFSCKPGSGSSTSTRPTCIASP